MCLNKTKKIVIIALFIFILTPGLALSQGLKDAAGKLTQVNQGAGLSSELDVSVNNVVNAVLYIVGTIFLLLIVYGSFVWIKSAGREGEIDRAKKILITSITGIAVIMAAYGITNYVLAGIAK